MRTTWESFAGDEEVFAVRVSLAPMEGEGPGWGRLQVWADGLNLSLHQDGDVTVDSVHWDLAPLATWYELNRVAALHESRLPHPALADDAATHLARAVWQGQYGRGDAEVDAWDEAQHSWWARHDLRAARAGGAFPDVVIRRTGADVEVSWSAQPIAGAYGLRFLAGSGAVLLPAADAARTLRDTLGALAGELRRRGVEVDSPDTEPEERDMTTSLLEPRPFARGETRAEEAFRWLVGLDAERSGAAAAALPALDDIEEAAGILVGSVDAAMLFGSMRPDLTQADVSRLANLMLASTTATGDHGELDPYARAEPVRADVPSWEQGYDLADEMRELLAPGGGAVDPIAVAGALGVVIAETTLDDTGTRGVAITSPAHAPTVSLNLSSPFNRNDAGRRFTVAHELCHLLFDRDRGARLSLASGPWAPPSVERRANAFAAAFLMPRAGIAEVIAGADDTRAAIGAVARRFGVNASAAAHHLAALGFISEEEREATFDAAAVGAT